MVLSGVAGAGKHFARDVQTGSVDARAIHLQQQTLLDALKQTLSVHDLLVV